MSSYVYVNEKDLTKIINLLKAQKNVQNRELIASLDFQLKKNKIENSKYRLAARSLLSKFDNKMYSNDDLIVEDDALVSENSQGAYVHCWVWVENESKGRKTRKVTK